MARVIIFLELADALNRQAAVGWKWSYLSLQIFSFKWWFHIHHWLVIYSYINVSVCLLNGCLPWLSMSLSACLYVSLPVFLLAYLPISIYLYACQSIIPFAIMNARNVGSTVLMSTYVYINIGLSVYRSFCICLSVRLSVCAWLLASLSVNIFMCVLFASTCYWLCLILVPQYNNIYF